MNIPRVELLRDQIANAKNRELDKQRIAAKEFIERFAAHLKKLVLAPEDFTSRTSYIEEVRGDMYTSGGNSDFLLDCFFFDCVKSELLPLGYRVEKSHDGGGMYSTIVVRWDIERPRRKFGDVGPPYERSNVDMPPCTGISHIYPPGTK